MYLIIPGVAVMRLHFVFFCDAAGVTMKFCIRGTDKGLSYLSYLIKHECEQKQSNAGKRLHLPVICSSSFEFSMINGGRM